MPLHLTMECDNCRKHQDTFTDEDKAKWFSIAPDQAGPVCELTVKSLRFSWRSTLENSVTKIACSWSCLYALMQNLWRTPDVD